MTELMPIAEHTPYQENGYSFVNLICPSCFSVIGHRDLETERNSHPDFCPHCGQKLAREKKAFSKENNMVEMDITIAVNHLIEGTANKVEQQICGIILKNLMESKGVKPEYKKDKPYCPTCNQPINTKQKDGVHIYRHCKCCGQKIDWGE